jgi:hypothetical protein
MARIKVLVVDPVSWKSPFDTTGRAGWIGEVGVQPADELVPSPTWALSQRRLPAHLDFSLRRDRATLRSGTKRDEAVREESGNGRGIPELARICRESRCARRTPAHDRKCGGRE